MKFNLKTVTAKIESAYGTDPLPTALANVVIVQNLDLNPLVMETDEYAPVMPNFGRGERIVGATWCTVSFDVLMCGGGTPLGTVPNSGVFNRACAMSQVVSAGTSVSYGLVSTGEESCTMYFYWDGVLQKVVGARGTWQLKATAKKAIVKSYSFTGLNVPMTDLAMPAPTLPTIPRPVAVNKANTVLTIDGYAVRLSEYSIDLGNQVQYRNHTNREDVQVMDRAMTGKVTMELPLVAEKDFLGASGFITQALAAPMSIVHGTVAGNRITCSMPKAQFFNPKPRSENGLLMLECDLHIARNAAGNDEYSEVYT